MQQTARQIHAPRIAVNWRRPTSLLSAAVKGGLRLSALGLPTGHTMSRYAMYVRLTEAAARFIPPEQRNGHPRVVALSRSLDLVRVLPYATPDVIDGEYPEYDLLSLSTLPDASVDVLLSDQVLEHVNGNPQDAFNASYRVLKPGGIAIHTTCLIQELHGGRDATGHLHDYWRFTPNGLKQLARRFSRVEADGWGNRLAFAALRYVPVPHAPWHPLHRIAMRTTPGFLISTWVIAQKER